MSEKLANFAWFQMRSLKLRKLLSQIYLPIAKKALDFRYVESICKLSLIDVCKMRVLPHFCFIHEKECRCLWNYLRFRREPTSNVRPKSKPQNFLTHFNVQSSSPFSENKKRMCFFHSGFRRHAETGDSPKTNYRFYN